MWQARPRQASAAFLLLLGAAILGTSSSLLINKEKKVLVVAEGRCKGRLIRVSRRDCTGLFMDPSFRWIEY